VCNLRAVGCHSFDAISRAALEAARTLYEAPQPAAIQFCDCSAWAASAGSDSARHIFWSLIESVQTSRRLESELFQ